MPRKYFYQISPLTYQISVWKGCFLRNLRDALHGTKFAETRAEPLGVLVYEHSSLIRRTLGNVDPQLQENKAANLALAAPLVSHIVIRPGEIFSFWHLVGACTEKKGYKTGLTIEGGVPAKGIGGGMCQFTNLLHWMVLHSPLTVTELHHHDGLDLFPDFGRKVPFGVGTSVFYNYIDYRVANHTDTEYQLIVTVTQTHLCGELRASAAQKQVYHVAETEQFFTQENGIWFRNNAVERRCVDKQTGNTVSRQEIVRSHARVMYDAAFINPEKIRK